MRPSMFFVIPVPALGVPGLDSVAASLVADALVGVFEGDLKIVFLGPLLRMRLVEDERREKRMISFLTRV